MDIFEKVLLGIYIGFIVLLLGWLINFERGKDKTNFLECIKITHYCRHESIMGSYLLPNCQEKLNLELVKWCYDKFVK